MKFIEDFKTASLYYYDQLLFVLPKIVLAILVFVVMLYISSRLKRALEKYLLDRLKDTLLVGFIGKIFRTVMILLALLIAMSIMGLGKAASGLMAGAGVSAFIIGFAFKDIGENFLAGFIMAFDRPFRIGDWVAIAGHEGTIVGLSLRDVHLKTFDGRDVFIPNGMIVRNPIVNYTIDGFLRYSFSLRLVQTPDVNKVTELIYTTLKSIHGMLEGDRSPAVFIKNYDQSGLVFEIRYWLETDDKTVSGNNVKSEAISRCVNLLEKEGFQLAADKIDIQH